MQKFLVNGRTAEALDISDRALHYGDGLFETLAVANGRLLCWDRHLQRLLHGCEALAIAPPPPRLLLEEATQLCEGAGRCVLKIIVSRGSGGRGYAPPGTPATTRLLGLYPWPEAPAGGESGLTLAVCRIRLASQPALAGHKHLNRLEQVLARLELVGSDADDGLLLDADDNVIEAISSNVFAVRGTELLTPDLSRAGVSGTIRAAIRELSPGWGYRVSVRPLALDELMNAEEVFLTNSISGVRTVRRLAGRTIGAGPVSARIRAELINAECILA